MNPLPLCMEIVFTWMFLGKQNAIVKVKSEVLFYHTICCFQIPHANTFHTEVSINAKTQKRSWLLSNLYQILIDLISRILLTCCEIKPNSNLTSPLAFCFPKKCPRKTQFKTQCLPPKRYPPLPLREEIETEITNNKPSPRTSSTRNTTLHCSPLVSRFLLLQKQHMCTIIT